MGDPNEPDATEPIEAVPSDLRDVIEATPDSLRPSVEARHDLTDVPARVRRPDAAAPSGAPQVTRDPTLSRAVDAEAAGVDPATMGFGERGERDGEAGHPGPLAPDVEDPAPDQ